MFDFKKIIVLFFIVMLLTIPFSVAENGDYTIPEVTKHIEILDDGACIINEEIIYDIEGSVNGVYRDIPLSYSQKQNIENISVETPGYYNTLEIINTGSNVRIKVWLYKNKEKTQKISNKKVNVTFKYTFNKGVKIYNDIAEFQYTSWGDEWESKVGILQTYIKIPGSSQNILYWNNPDTYITSSNWTDNQLITTAKDIPSHTSLEQRILLPKSYFKSTENAQLINQDAKEQIIKDQEEYARQQFFQNTINSIISFIMLIFMIIPLGIYYRYGREAKISYNEKYEYNIPTDSKPVEVNDIVIGDVATVDFNAFNAVILDLIDRGYLKIISPNTNNTILTTTSKTTANLEEYEIDVIKYLQKFTDSKGNIVLADIIKKEDKSSYLSFMNMWKKKAEKSIPETLINNYFDSYGYNIFKKILVLMTVIAVIGFFLSMFINYMIMWILSFVLLFEIIILYCIPNTTFGRWTKEGKEYHDKWINFKKYITDYSLINQKTPESIQVWGRYLVYAAALGCADKATDTMKKYFDMQDISEDLFNDNDIILFTYYGGFHNMNSSFSTFQSSNSDDGGIGSAGGGGFGGGGGGTF